MSNTEPYVALACICEKVVKEGSVYSAINIVDTVTVTIPPGGESTPSVEFNILVGLKSGDVKGKSELSMKVHRPSGKPVVKEPGPWPILLNGGEHGMLVHGKILLPATEFGLFWFDVIWNGRKLTSIPLKLIQGPTLPVTETSGQRPRAGGSAPQVP